MLTGLVYRIERIVASLNPQSLARRMHLIILNSCKCKFVLITYALASYEYLPARAQLSTLFHLKLFLWSEPDFVDGQRQYEENQSHYVETG